MHCVGRLAELSEEPKIKNNLMMNRIRVELRLVFSELVLDDDSK